jgi:hypothetical protein
LNKFRKAITAGISTALLASLFTIVAAPVLAAASITSVGTVPLDSTSTNTLTVTLSEEARAGWPNPTTAPSQASVQVRIADSAGAATVEFSGTPVVSAPGSLEASASVSASILTITIKSSDTANFESITITGLKIKVLAGAAIGPMQAFLQVPAVPAASETAAGNLQFFDNTFASGAAAGTATGKVVTTTAPGATSFTVAVDDARCPFNTRPDGTNPDLLSIVVGTGATQEILTTVTAAPVPPVAPLFQQTITLGTPASLAFGHAAGEVVTQENVTCTAPASPFKLASPGTVAAKATLKAVTSPVVRAGRNNEAAGNLTVAESGPALITGGSNLKFTITTAGVVYSTTPVATVTIGDLILSGSTPPVLSADRKTLTVTVAGASTVSSTITISSITYDLASTVPAGTKVNVQLVISNGLAVDPAAGVSNATTSFAIVPTASQPTIYIGENGQNTGMITFTESGPGFFTDGTGSANKFWVCIDTRETFTNAPYAIVSGGDLKLLATDGSAATTVRGRPVTGNGSFVDALVPVSYPAGSCYFWSVYSKSTVASTVQIVGQAADGSALAAGPNNGPQVNVPNFLAPGTTQMSLWLGTISAVTAAPDAGKSTQFGAVANAIRVYRNSLSIVALSQPSMAAGSVNALAGNLQLTETQLGQLDAGDLVCVEILPRTSASSAQARRDVFMGAASTNNLPVVETNGNASGLLASSLATIDDEDCDTTTVEPVAGAISFSFNITQGSVNTLGVITIKNIHYTVLTDAINGPIQVNVFVDPVGGIQQSQGIVSNARVGAVAVAEATINRGLNTRTGFGFATEVVTRGSYVTIRSRASGSAPGDLVQIWVKTKTTAWKLETNRRVSPNGFMYYSGKVLNLGYRYYRVVYPSGAVSNTVRAFGR